MSKINLVYSEKPAKKLKISLDFLTDLHTQKGFPSKHKKSPLEGLKRLFPAENIDLRTRQTFLRLQI